MPEFRDKEVSLCFDICGCPNRCRHCWLGQASGRKMPLSEVTDAFARVREHVASGRESPHLERVRYFGSYFREPHCCDNYRELREMELESNDGEDYAADYQLLSVRRLARDPGYAAWARGTGVRKCQVSLAGIGETNDWFYRRRGAHDDIIAATLRLVESGIQPRWQVFLTKRGLPELEDVLRLVDELRLRERLAEQGLAFELFLNDMTPLGEARRHQDQRLTEEDVPRIPPELVRSSEQYFGKPILWTTEGEWVAEILAQEDRPIGLDVPPRLWLDVASDWGTYANLGSLEPWWLLGNLRGEGIAPIVSRFVGDEIPGLRSARSLTLHTAARSHGDASSRRIYLSRTDLHQLWLEMECERHQGQACPS